MILGLSLMASVATHRYSRIVASMVKRRKRDQNPLRCCDVLAHRADGVSVLNRGAADPAPAPGPS